MLPIHTFSGDCSCPALPWEDDAELWVSSVIDLLHPVGVLTVVKGSQTEPEIVVSQYYKSL